MTDEAIEELDGSEIAVVGMALRVPGANNVGEYWNNLRDGVESVRRFSDEELREAGVSDAELKNPNYVPATAPLDGAKEFDAAFFGFSPRDAALMDPQHRHYIEVCWEALEHAGYDPARYDGAIGVFGGSGHNAYMSYNLLTNPDLVDSVGFFLVRHTNNDKDFLVTRVSYLFDLTGPALNVQTACSTSLVAVHLGVQSLLSGESDMILAGGVTIEMPLNQGYVYKEGEILAKDGHCRAFDAESSGTVFGSGAGVVVLKRLEDALADRDTIHAVVRGTAINNDGSNKVGYLAPSVDGQAAAVGEALLVADVDPETIGFIECHGTGTEIGDPIEVAALTQAFRSQTDKANYCALGSVKTNIGHLDTAAGVAAMIKACLALEHKVIPPTVHFESPNPRIGFEGSPFFVNGELLDWAEGDEPRRAGVSSLGVGGTNAHVVLEEAPIVQVAAQPESRPWQLLALSAKGPTALDELTANMAEFLAQNPAIDLADVAHTLQVGRRGMDVRRFAVVSDVADAAQVLSGEQPKRIFTGTASVKERSVVFMFPGQGAQYATMGAGLYETEPAFREAVDECAETLEPLMGFDLRTVLFPEQDKVDWATEKLTPTEVTQPAIFTIEYALAKMWMSWGIEPAAMIGHSIGEYVAACLSEVFSLPDALRVVATRGRLMQALPSGSMLAIPMAASEVELLLTDGLSLAAMNGPSFSVVAGPDELITELQTSLEANEVAVRRLHTSHAFHSSMMDPMLDEFAAVVANTERGEAKIPFVTNVTGTWITPEQIADPAHWARHVRNAVNFVGGLTTILDRDSEQVLLEVGPGRTLSTFAKQVEGPHQKTTVTSMRHATADAEDLATALSALGEVWAAGAIDDWTAFYERETRRRIPLPTYPFQHQEFWVEPGESHRSNRSLSLEKNDDVADWFYIPTWSQTSTPPAAAESVARWLILVDDCGVGSALAETVSGDAEVITVARGQGFENPEPGRFTIDPGNRAHYGRLIGLLAEQDQLPDGVAYLWPLTEQAAPLTASAELDTAQVDSFYGQMFLAQALGEEGTTEDIDWWVLTNNMQSIAGEPVVNPVQALAMGPVTVLAQEYSHISCRGLDISWPAASPRHAADLVEDVAAELLGRPDDEVIALRRRSRWVQDYVASPMDESLEDRCLINDGGTYLITGGTGGIGLEIADHLANTASARLVLMARSPLPERDAWQRWLDDHRDNDPTSHKIRRLQAMEAAGAEIMVVAADVTDAEQVTGAIADAVERFGALDGVFHAAGHLADGLISMKAPEQAASVLAPKVEGTLALEAALTDVALDFFALFSSVSSIAGTAGQVDYAAANSFLNAYAQHRTATGGDNTVAIGWGPWQDVGMTVRTAIELGLIDDEQHVMGTEHSLLDRWYEKQDEDVFETDFSTESHWLLDEHRSLGGTAIMPGTGYLDLVTAAFDQRSSGEAYEIADVFFMAPFMVADGETATLRITLNRSDGDFVISSSTNGVTQEHARGSIRVGASSDQSTVDLDAVRGRCGQRAVDFDRFENPQLLWGPRWNNLRHLAYGNGEALATLALPSEFADDLGDHRLHPAIIDLATGAAQDLIDGFTAGTDFFVPFSYRRLRKLGPLVEEMYSHIRYRPGDDQETAIFDVVMVDAGGQVLVEIDGFVMRRASGEIAEVVSTSQADDVAEPMEPILESLENGIAPAEGMRALRRVLSGRAPAEVAVVAQNLHALIQRSIDSRVGAAGSESGTGISHQRPDVSTPFVAPSSERELAIASIWEEMLGVEGVGVHDDFFELGGHSLLLTQVITRVKKLTSAEVSLFTLFEASTISDLIVEMEKAEAEEDAPGAAAVPTLGRVSRDGYRTQVGALQAQGKERRSQQ